MRSHAVTDARAWRRLARNFERYGPHYWRLVPWDQYDRMHDQRDRVFPGTPWRRHLMNDAGWKALAAAFMAAIVEAGDLPALPTKPVTIAAKQRRDL